MLFEGLAQVKLIFVSGKGGVGKTTIAAALGLAGAIQGRRTLCLEPSGPGPGLTPLQRSLGFEGAFGPDRLQWGSLTADEGQRLFLQRLLKVHRLVEAITRSSVWSGFFAGGPGFPEMAMLYHLLERVQPMRGPAPDLCVVDLPASGHALALAQLPTFLLRFLPGGPIRTAAVELLALLTDPSRCATVLVAAPESLSASETVELAKGFTEHRLAIAGVVLNRFREDPFTRSERTLLALRAEGRPFWGERELWAVDRAARARDELERALALPTRCLPPLPLEEPALALALARQVLLLPDRPPESEGLGR